MKIAANNIQKNTRIKSPYVQLEHGDLLFIEESPKYGNSHTSSVSSSKQYVLKVKDMPHEDQPREKMLHFGPESLSLVELLAVVLVQGTKKEDVMSISNRIVKEYGHSALSTNKDAHILAQELEIPLAKACQIIATGEIGRRLFSKNLSGLATIRTPEDVYAYVTEMHSLPKEQLRGIYLDTHHKVIHTEVLSIGTINASMIHPREVFKPAIEYGAAAVILVHNHPSGVNTPSQSDIEITKQIILAGKVLGINILDHVVVTRDSFESVPVSYE